MNTSCFKEIKFLEIPLLFTLSEVFNSRIIQTSFLKDEVPGPKDKTKR